MNITNTLQLAQTLDRLHWDPQSLRDMLDVLYLLWQCPSWLLASPLQLQACRDALTRFRQPLAPHLRSIITTHEPNLWEPANL